MPRDTDKKSHITATAAHIVATEGLEALSIRTVAKAAACSRGLVEHYFRNKEALVQAVDDWAVETYLERASRAVNRKEGLEALEARLRQLLPFNRTILQEWQLRVVFWRQASVHPTSREVMNSRFATVYMALLSDMQTAQANGDIPVDLPVVVLSEWILFMIIGLSVACLNDDKLRRKRPLERRIEMILVLLRSGDVRAMDIGGPDEY